MRPGGVRADAAARDGLARGARQRRPDAGAGRAGRAGRPVGRGVRPRGGGLAVDRPAGGRRAPRGRARAGGVGPAGHAGLAGADAGHAPAEPGRARRRGAGGGRADGGRHDRHRPAPGPHVRRGGLRSVQLGQRAGAAAAVTLAAAARARRRWSSLAARGLLARRPGAAGLGGRAGPGLAARGVAGPGRAGRRRSCGIASSALPLYSLVWRAGRVGGRRAAGRGRRWSLAGLAGTLRFAAAEDAAGPLGAEPGLGGTRPPSATVALAWALAWAAGLPGLWRGVVVGGVALALATPGRSPAWRWCLPTSGFPASTTRRS